MSKYSYHSDGELAGLLKENDHVAFSEIYKRYWKKLLFIAWNYCHQTDLSKDIVHEVFTSLWERRAIVSIGNLSAFLATSVKFSLFKYHEKEHRRAKLASENYAFDEFSHDEEQLDALFLKEYINGIVEEMPEKCKLVFKYSRNDGLKNAEIAEKINISEKGVEANLTRALNIIRGGLKHYGVQIAAVYCYLSLFR